MIKLNNELHILQHSGYPAMTSEPSYGDSLYTKDIYCEGFNQNTGVGIDDSDGIPLSQEEVNGLVHRIPKGGYRVATLPYGYTITFQQHPDNIQEMVTMAYVAMDKPDEKLTREIFYEMEELADIIEEETEAKVQNTLQELLLNDGLKIKLDEAIESFCEEDEPVYDRSSLEAFDQITELAREWWFELTTEEAKKTKIGIMLSSDALVGTLDIVRMYINQPEFDGVREELEPVTLPTSLKIGEKVLVENYTDQPIMIEKSPYYDEIIKDEMLALNRVINEQLVKNEFNAMFSNQIRYTPTPHQREQLGKKIIKWVQGLIQ